MEPEKLEKIKEEGANQQHKEHYCTDAKFC